MSEPETFEEWEARLDQMNAAWMSKRQAAQEGWADGDRAGKIKGAAAQETKLRADLEELAKECDRGAEKAGDYGRKHDDHRADQGAAEQQALGWAASKIRRVLKGDTRRG